MTDAVVSYALAKAIGWGSAQIVDDGCIVLVQSQHHSDEFEIRDFDYRDRTVWAGLVEGYGLSVIPSSASLRPAWFCYARFHERYADTPAKAIALLVIELAKRGKLPERKV